MSAKEFSGQQAFSFGHQKSLMFKQKPLLKFVSIILLFFVSFAGSCISVKKKQKTPTLLDVQNATQADLIAKVNYFAKINSMRAFMDVKFEDKSNARAGISEKYTTANGEIVVQRPASILLRVKIPVIGTDVAQMTSDGEKFRVAVLQDGADGKNKRFVIGTNANDYSILQQRLANYENGVAKDIKTNVNAFAEIRPQHFTDAMLVRPIDESKYTYALSTIVNEEVDFKQKKKSPLYWVLRGYYLLEEFEETDSGKTVISRRFWFDRVGLIRLARQQIFDKNGEIESDIVYGQTGRLADSNEYILPLQIEVARPKEKYKMTLKYQAPGTVSIGKSYKREAFILQNRWNLKELDLDKRLEEIRNGRNQTSVLESTN